VLLVYIYFLLCIFFIVANELQKGIKKCVKKPNKKKELKKL
jgi:hypothetical protein